MANKDRRFKNIWEWEKNSLKNPEFVLDVKWQRAEKSLKGLLYPFESKNKKSLKKRLLVPVLQAEIFEDFGQGYSHYLKKIIKEICSSVDFEISFPDSLLEEFAKKIKSVRKRN